MTIELNLPDWGDEVTMTVVGDKIVFCKLLPEEYAENPLEDSDGNGEIFNFSRDFKNHIDRDRVWSLFQEHGFVVMLDDYGDGDRWRVGNPPFLDFTSLVVFEALVNDPWAEDWFPEYVVEQEIEKHNFNGVWIPDKALLAEVEGLDREAAEAKMVEFAKQCCALYSAWASGDVWRWDVEIHPVEYHDADEGEEPEPIEDYEYYAGSDPLFEEGIGPFYGNDEHDTMRAEMRDAVEGYFADLAKEKQAA